MPAETISNEQALLEFLEQSGNKVEADRLRKQIEAAGKSKEIAPASTTHWLVQLITENNHMKEMKRQVVKLAVEDDAVLIRGETGTGKELIAHALHGARDASKFVSINCAGMPKELIESELFGHIKGAFTGAEKDKVGLCVQANEGTLFLDEIGELHIDLQAKLLRVMQEKVVRPVGSNIEQKVSCRFVSATHCDLLNMVVNNKFREDLFWRLSTFELTTLPLRDRPEDIRPIVESLEGDKKKFPYDKVTWTPNLLAGNVRSLQQIVRRYLVLGILPS